MPEAHGDLKFVEGRARPATTDGDGSAPNLLVLADGGPVTEFHVSAGRLGIRSAVGSSPTSSSDD